ncbi:hypothetical protein K4F52_007214 [Lecanicillium sp. MT-2017a]|nr:hypothetical protein K4F52_007214 [Lecanicillium sp. MT-2017a]
MMDTIGDAMADTMEQVTDWVEEISFDVDDLDFDIPPLNVDLDIDVPDFPEAELELQLDNVELYVALDTTISGGLTYQVNLFRTQGMAIQVTQKMFMDIGFSIDLILSTEAELTIQSGFHIKLNNGSRLRMALFAEESSGMVFNGGKFEFLPVTIESAGTVLKAVLRLSLGAGFSLYSADLTPGLESTFGDFDPKDFTAAAGVESRIYANVAELVTNVTTSTGDDDAANCALQAVQEYKFAVGAAAGASVGLGHRFWAAAPSTEIPIFVTTLAAICAQSSSPATTTAEATIRDLENGESLETLTLTREETYTATQCVDASWPVTTEVAAVTPVEFGTNARELVATTGKPEAYGGESNDGDDGFFDRETGGISNAVVLGLSIGLGVPILIATIASIVFFRRRSNRASKLELSAASMSATQSK